MTRRSLSQAEKVEWLRLARTERVGPITFRQLLKRFGTARAALDALPDLARRGGVKASLRPPPQAQIENEVAALERKKGQFIALCEPAYSQALAAVEDAPPVIAVLGNMECLPQRCIGIVGARNASLNGRKMAERLARDLGQEDLVIISGLARGIDTAAHQASIETGTVAVLAGGVDVVYPEENRRLYEKIIESGGAIVSDQPLGAEPRAQLFPRRNRIISGLSLGVIVVEAARQSGSLITARLALEQGREVFAVPGSPLDPRAHGTNDLLRQGAVLTENAEDVLKHIHAAPRTSEAMLPGFEEPQEETPDESDLDAVRKKILENLSPSPVPVDELIRHSGFPPAAVFTVLLELELAGQLERQPGHKVAYIA